MMLNITYYYVEQLVRPEAGWDRQMVQNCENYNGGFQDKAQAEKTPSSRKVWLGRLFLQSKSRLMKLSACKQ